MNSFELYLLKSFMSIMIFYLFYFILLKHETSFKWNRGFLLFAGIFSMFVPLVNFNFPVETFGREITVVLSPILILPGVSNSSDTADSSFIVLVIYSTVSAILLLRFLWKIFQMLSMSRNNNKTIIHGYRAVLLDKLRSPFSFFNTIFLPAEEYNRSNVEKIIKHEAVHINENHSIDLVLYELILVCQWFNPFAWLCRKELIAQHEFSADAQILKNGTDEINYKSILLSYAMHLGGSSITNNFNTLLKRRFEMLANRNSDNKGKVKLLFSLPLIVLLIFIFGCKNEGENNTTGTNVSSSNTPATSNMLQDQVFSFVDEMPSYPAGQGELLKFIGKNVNYPKTAKDNNIQGKIFVGFTVEKDGAISNVELLKGIGSGCDEEAVRVTKLMGKWNPGRQDGKPVRVKMVIPFQFKLQ